MALSDLPLLQDQLVRQSSRPGTAPRVSGPMVPVRHRLSGVRRELSDTVTLALEPLDAPLAPFWAGQFNMLWAFGGGEVPVSVSGDPTSAGPMQHTVRAVGAATRALCRLPPGATIGVRGPFGSHWDVAGATGRDVVIVAGGLGLAPLRPVVHEVLARRSAFGRVVLAVGARQPSALLYLDALRSWGEHADIEVMITVDSAEAGWRGDVGVVTELLPQAVADGAHTSAFVCGPEPMMRFSAATLLALGVTAPQIQVSLERNMKCAIAHCGRCQVGPVFVCREGPVFRYDLAGPLLALRGL